MTVKTSISVTDQQEAYARSLVKSGRFSSLNTVLQNGLELLRAESEAKGAEIAAVRALLDDRAKGPFISADEFSEQVEQMIERKCAGMLG